LGFLGIGQGRITDNLGTFVSELSGAFTVPDSKSIEMVYDLLDSEGLYIGASSALNVVAAVELAQRLRQGISTSHATVTFLLIGYRFNNRDHNLRWGIPLSNSPVFQGMAQKQGFGGRYSTTSEKICRFGLILSGKKEESLAIHK